VFIGHYAVAFAGLLLAAYFGNVAGPPPPSAHALALFAMSAWLLPPGAGWFDAHRNGRQSLREATGVQPGTMRPEEVAQ